MFRCKHTKEEVFDFLREVIPTLGTFNFRQGGKDYTCCYSSEHQDVNIYEHSNYPISSFANWMYTLGDTINGKTIDELMKEYEPDFDADALSALL